MKKQILKSALIALTGVGLMVGSASATKVEFLDTWNNWDNQVNLNTGTAGSDTIGDPHVYSIIVDFDHINKIINTVQVVFDSNYKGDFIRVRPDSLLINTNYNGTSWDGWDYYTINGYNGDDKLYSIKNFDGGITDSSDPKDYLLTFTQGHRKGNPIGIDLNKVDATLLDKHFAPSWAPLNNKYALTWDFTQKGLSYDTGFFIAYTEMCANDVAGGGYVPEPTTMLLFGTGMLGLTAFARRRK